MNRFPMKIVPVLYHLKSNGKVDLRIIHSASSINLRSQYIHKSNHALKNGFICHNFSSTIGANTSNLQFLDVKPVFTSSRRHFSNDFADGRSVYKWLSESAPVEFIQNFVVSVHDYTGLPWWGTIICTTAFLRIAITLPLGIYQANILAKVENIALVDMPDLAKEVKKEVAGLAMKNDWNERQTQLMYKKILKGKWDALVIQYNCHPFKGTVTLWFQLPMWIFFTTALRNLSYMLPYHDSGAQLQYLQMSVGGFLWIPNLTLPDETWFFPAILGLSNLAIIELQSLRRIRQAPKLQKYATNFFRCMSLALIPISATVPSAVCLYWTTSSLLGLGQNLLLMSNGLRRYFHIPDTPTTVDNPYLQLLADIREKGRNVASLLWKRK